MIAHVLCDPSASRIEETASILAAVHTEPRHLGGQTVIEETANGAANNGNAPQFVLIIDYPDTEFTALHL